MRSDTKVIMLKKPSLSAKWPGMIRPGSEPALRSIVSKPESEGRREKKELT